ncbi:uncharacterized protein LOC122084577 isoform X3 [Macadamia integrifolia]|uniref:uncharacterized protein LOC122084577 isoform X3 n=1 Tax=Macadamia integrifolia TaxID=60698 RepID=UPI001C4EC394|nr:uncharacterized protein LOC122084577 isoform X3 [Macadamia integrifolia]
MAVLMGFHPGSLLLINQIKSDRGCLLLAVVMKFKSGYSFSVEVATQVVPKKLGITVVQNDQGDKVPTHTTTEKIVDGGTGDVADDHYHWYMVKSTSQNPAQT